MGKVDGPRLFTRTLFYGTRLVNKFKPPCKQASLVNNPLSRRFKSVRKAKLSWNQVKLSYCFICQHYCRITDRLELILFTTTLPSSNY
jgi:hypothetical protein